nr:cytochrome ubiquinol oxidase subunit I [Actinomycetota bacterium]
MSALALSRWQFAVTIIYHFIFVPITIGMALSLAIMQTAYHRTKNEKYAQIVDFFGKLFAINFAIGIVTGIVQEFQFGMNWSQYSIFVGNIFGAPLAIEGLLAFFLESTFLGIWLFGKGKVSERIHLLSIWMVSIGTIFSALFILAANSFMQHPVGYKIDPTTHRAVMTNFFALLGNPTLIVTFFHTLLAAITTAAAIILAVSAYQLAKRGKSPAFSASVRFGVVVLFVSMFLNAFVGHIQGQVMTKEQPMKMAAAEALYNTQTGASFSVLTIGNLSGQPIF